MKRRAFLRDAVVWTGLLWIPRAFGQQSALAPRVRQFRTVAAGQSCTQLVAQEVDNDYWDTSTGNIAQKVKFNGGTICQIDLRLKWQSGTSKAKVQLWSNPDRTGTQYGSDSNVIDTDTTTAFYPNAAWGQFTFGTNPTPPGDFWLCLVATAGATQWRMDYNHSAGATWYPYTDATDDQTYCAYAFAANRTSTDFCFRVHTLQ